MPLTGSGVSFVSGVQYVISIKDSEGSLLLCAHASTAYALKNKIENATDFIDFTSNLT
jgi:hypothetical protein